MLWFTIHNLIHLLPFDSNQNKNLFTFVVGVVLYTIIYSFLGSLKGDNKPFLTMFFNFFLYIILADGFAMAIIYKNFYKITIMGEVKDVFATNENDNNSFEKSILDKKNKINKINEIYKSDELNKTYESNKSDESDEFNESNKTYEINETNKIDETNETNKIDEIDETNKINEINENDID